jgi:LacI family transcriptional regulator
VYDTLSNCGKDLSGIYVYDASALETTGKIVKQLNLSNIVVIGHECLGGCRELIQEGWIHATLCQERFSQGYYPLKLMYDYLRSGTRPEPHYYSNVNIVFRSNLNMLQMNESGCGFQ